MDKIKENVNVLEIEKICTEMNQRLTTLKQRGGGGNVKQFRAVGHM